ncbi:MAG: hypothetical protein V4546_02485 [Bacteroidota bacterium]
METLIIDIPENKSTLVKTLLKELGVVIRKKGSIAKIPNATTIKAIEDARNGVNISGPITDIDKYIDSL